MPGLLDFFNTPEGMQGMSLLAAAGPSMQPQNLASRFAQAGQTYGALQDQALDRNYRTMQIDSLKEGIAAAKRKNEIINGLLSGFGGGGAQPAPIDQASAALGAGAEAGSVGPTLANAARLPAQPAGGGIGGMLTPDTLFKLKAAGVGDFVDIAKLSQPNWMDVGGNLVNTNAPGFQGGFQPSVKVGQGGEVTLTKPDGKGGVTVSAPEGAIPTFGAFQGARERMKNDNTLLPTEYVDERTGRPVGGSVGSYLDRRPMANLGGGSLSPELSEFIRQDAAKNGVINPQARMVGGSPTASYGLGAVQNTAPAGLQSKAEGAAATEAATLPFKTAEKVNSTWLSTSYEPTLKAGNAAGDMLTNVQVARQSMRNMGGTGWGTDAKAVGASVLSGLGIAPENAKMYAANAETFQNAAMSNLATQLNAATGPQTEGDANRVGKTFAQLKNTPKANEFILDVTEAKAQRDKMKSDFFQQALPIARQKGDLQEVEREWAKRAPSVFSMPTMQKWAGGIK
jgi:hypothetical protein